MKNTKCPEKKTCFGYKDNACEGCDVGDEITKLHKRIDRLKKQNETLTIQRNAWALTAKVVKPEWISVDERLPEEKGFYLTFQDGKLWINNFDAQKCKFGVWWHYTPDGRREKNYRFIEADKITHWMPMPEPPMMEGKSK